MPRNEAAHIYYIEASWDGIELYGNAEFQFALAQYDFEIWDSSNDYSYIGLTKDSKTVSSRIPVYVDGKLVFGEEPSKTASPSPKPSLTPGSSAQPQKIDCSVSYKIKESWATGAIIDLTITNNGTSTISGWELLFDFPGDQVIKDSWNAAISQSGKTVSAKNQSWTTKIPPNSSVNFGFNVSCTNFDIPAEFMLNGVKCTVK